MSVSNKKNKPSILIVDDERGTREVLANSSAPIMK